MDNPKIIKTCCYYSVLNLIKQEFSSRFPVYLRGIAASKGNEIIFPELTEAGNNARIRNINDIVEAGTELELSPEGLLLDRPEDLVDDRIITRVAPYSGINNTYLMFIPTALRNISRRTDEIFTPGERSYLALTVLVYDGEKVLPLGGVKIGLPQDPVARENALLKAYVLDNLECESSD